MNSIDLLRLLYLEKVLPNITLYGRVGEHIKRPSNLYDTCQYDENGTFVRFDLFAAKFTNLPVIKQKYYIQANSDVVMVNGSICAFVENTYKVNEWYSITGNLTFGEQTPITNFVTMYNYHKEGNLFYFTPIKLDNIDYSPNINPNDVLWLKYLLMSDDEGCILQPNDVKLLHPLTGNIDTAIHNKNIIDADIPLTEEQKAYLGFESNLNIVSREEVDYKDIEKLDVKLQEAKERKNVYVSDLRKEIDSVVFDEETCIKTFINNLIINFGTADGGGQSGREVVRWYIRLFAKDADVDYMNTKAGTYLLNHGGNMLASLVDSTVPFKVSGTALYLYNKAFGKLDYFYAMVVAHILHIRRDTMESLYNSCNTNHLSIVKVIHLNPYFLQFLGRISFNDMEHLAYVFGVENRKLRNISLLYDYITDTDRTDGNTVITEMRLMHADDFGFTLTPVYYERLVKTSCYFTDKDKANIVNYLNSKFAPIKNQFNYFNKLWNSYVELITEDERQKIVNDFVDTGIGLTYRSFITTTGYVDKELYIYKKLTSIASRETTITKEEIDKLISEYEDENNIELEKEQREAIYLLTKDSGVISGVAGSGKTTTARCMKYVLTRTSFEQNLIYAAPTGKAANRLQEVVESPARTLHSLFKLDIEDTVKLIESEGKERELGGIFFFDEMSMVTLDVLYSSLKHISEDSKIYMFGDYRQLPPIGKGMPFRDMLTYMPSAILKVVKRTREDSGIARNSEYVNDFSETYNWKPLENAKDFITIPCKDEEISLMTKNVVMALKDDIDHEQRTILEKALKGQKLPNKYALNIDMSDIQVITPFKKDSYTWGSNKLNDMLQPIFNDTGTLCFYKSAYKKEDCKKFYTKDRIINTTNNYGLQWYHYDGDTGLHKIYGCGVLNGEVGTLKGIIKASNAIIYDEVEERPEDFEYSKRLRDDRLFGGFDAYFVIVEYYDYLEKRFYDVVYRAKIDVYKQEYNYDFNDIPYLEGDDLDTISLFYAGTVHKMQGSQNKVVILDLGVYNTKGFITRNMIYTALTRAQAILILLGSVSENDSSAINRARKDISNMDIHTVLTSL